MDLVFECVRCCCQGCCESAQTNTGYGYREIKKKPPYLTENPASTAMSRETQDPPPGLTDPSFRF